MSVSKIVHNGGDLLEGINLGEYVVVVLLTVGRVIISVNKVYQSEVTYYIIRKL